MFHCSHKEARQHFPCELTQENAKAARGGKPRTRLSFTMSFQAGVGLVWQVLSTGTCQTVGGSSCLIPFVRLVGSGAEEALW